MAMPVPDLAGYEWVAVLFRDAGRYGAGGMGPVALSWADLDAWARCAGVDVSVAELRLLRAMSLAFVAGLDRETAPHEPVTCMAALASADIAAAVG